jgi:hypothetical protein
VLSASSMRGTHPQYLTPPRGTDPAVLGSQLAELARIAGGGMRDPFPDLRRAACALAAWTAAACRRGHAAVAAEVVQAVTGVRPNAAAEALAMGSAAAQAYVGGGGSNWVLALVLYISLYRCTDEKEKKKKKKKKKNR